MMHFVYLVVFLVVGGALGGYLHYYASISELPGAIAGGVLITLVATSILYLFNQFKAVLDHDQLSVAERRRIGEKLASKREWLYSYVMILFLFGLIVIILPYITSSIPLWATVFKFGFLFQLAFIFITVIKMVRELHWLDDKLSQRKRESTAKANNLKALRGD